MGFFVTRNEYIHIPNKELLGRFDQINLATRSASAYRAHSNLQRCLTMYKPMIKRRPSSIINQWVGGCFCLAAFSMFPVAHNCTG